VGREEAAVLAGQAQPPPRGRARAAAERPSPGTGARPKPADDKSPQAGVDVLAGAPWEREGTSSAKARPCGSRRGSLLAARFTSSWSTRAARGFQAVISHRSTAHGSADYPLRRCDGVADHAARRGARAADRLPRTTLPVLTRSDLGRRRACGLLSLRASSNAHCTARSACCGKHARALQDGEHASNEELAMCRGAATIGTMPLEESLKTRHHLGASASAASRGEVTDVEEDEGDSTSRSGLDSPS